MAHLKRGALCRRTGGVGSSAQVSSKRIQALLMATALAIGVVLVTGADARRPPPPPRQRVWKPGVSAAVKFALQRRGTIAFAIRTRTRIWGWHRTLGFPSASVVKAMLLVAYLNESSVRGRRLSAYERELLSSMIRWSDNDAATSVLALVGSRGLHLVAYRSNMRFFTPVEGIWGTSTITAADQVRFLFRIDRLIPRRHRGYAMQLLASIVPWQRWGVAQVRPKGWKLYFKGGWQPGTTWVNHQVALLKRGPRRVSIAILTEYNESHEYGTETLRGIAARLLRGLSKAESVP